MTWRSAELTREAWANSGPRQLILAILTAFVLTAVAILTGYQAIQTISQESSRREAGSLVWTAIADDDSALSAAACEALGVNRGVSAAGGIFGIRPPDLTAFSGGPPVPTVFVTPHAPRVWTPDTALGHVVAGPDVIQTHAVGVGTTLVTRDPNTKVLVDAQAPDTLAHAGLRSRVAIPQAPQGLLTECWLRMEPGVVALGEDLLRFTFADAELTVAPHLRPSAEILSPAQQWQAFAATHVGIAGGILIGLVGTLLAWTRRAELAVYRTFGTNRGELALMLLVETVIVLIPAALTTAITALLVLGVMADGAIPREVLAAVGAVVGAATAATVAIAPLGALIATQGRVFDHLKDR